MNSNQEMIMQLLIIRKEASDTIAELKQQIHRDNIAQQKNGDNKGTGEEAREMEPEPLKNKIIDMNMKTKDLVKNFC